MLVLSWVVIGFNDCFIGEKLMVKLHSSFIQNQQRIKPKKDTQSLQQKNIHRMSLPDMCEFVGQDFFIEGPFAVDFFIDKDGVAEGVGNIIFRQQNQSGSFEPDLGMAGDAMLHQIKVAKKAQE